MPRVTFRATFHATVLRPLCRALLLLSAMLPALAGAGDTATMQTPGTLYAHPDRGSHRIMEVQRRAVLQVLEVRRDWVRVEAAGNRQGWVPESALSFDEATPATAGPSAAEGSVNPSRLRPRVVPRSTHRALVAGPHELASGATAIARLLGVPDINIARLPALRDAMPADPGALQRKLAALSEDLPAGAHVFLHFSGRIERRSGEDSCAGTLHLADGQAIPLEALSRQTDALARHADQLVVVLDADPLPGCSPASLFQTATRLLWFARPGKAPAGPRTLPLTEALLACLDGRGPRSAATGLATGTELADCARRMAGADAIAAGGNMALIPALIPLPPAGPVAPHDLLHALYLQRSPQRNVELQRQPASALDVIAFKVRSATPGHLYVLAAGEDGFTLLHPSAAAADQPGLGPTALRLPARDTEGRRWSRLLVLVTDARRNFLRAGFMRSGEHGFAPADARSLRDLPLEVLGGDSSPTCQQADLHHLDARQALACSAAFGAREVDLTVERALKSAPQR